MQQFMTFPLEAALDLQPLIAAPDTPLTEVIGLTSRSALHCHLMADEVNQPTLPQLGIEQTGCVLFEEDTQLVGILTERDIVRLIAENRSLGELTAAAVMSQPVVTLVDDGHSTVFTALERMNRQHIRHLPVLDQQGQVKGLLTPRRIRNLLQPSDLLKIRRVREVMTPDVVQALPTNSLLQITQCMNLQGVSCIVMVEPADDLTENHCPIGIITERDIVQFQRLELDFAQTQAQEVMSTPLSLVTPDDSLWTVHQKMQQQKVRRLVVADGHGTLRGIVTQRNLLPVDPAEIYEVVELLQQQITQLETQNHQLLQKRNQELEQLVQDRTSKLERRDLMRHHLAKGLATSTGEDFFQSLVTHLNQVLPADFAHIGQLVNIEGQATIRTLAVAKAGQLQSNFEYALAGTPCEEVIEQQSCMYHQGVQAVFPHDQMLRDLSIEGYLGIPLISSAKQVVGLIVVLCRQPLDDLAFIEEVLTILAQKTTAELERQTAETDRNRFLSVSLDLHCIAGFDGYFKTVNPAFISTLGYSIKELLAQPFLNFVHPEDRDATVRELEQLAMGTNTIAFENRYRCHDGSYRWFLWSATPYLQQQQIYASASDITKQKIIEQTLALRARQQTSVAQLGALALASRDIDGLMNEIVRVVSQTLEVEYCKVLQLRPDGESLLLKAGVGWQPGLVGQAIIGTEQESQAGYTLRSSRPVIVDNLETETRFSGPPLLLDHKVVSGMSVILQGQHQTYGVIGAHTGHHRLFNENDIDFLQSVANLLAQALDRHQIDQTLRQSEQEYRTLAENLPGIVYRVFPEDHNRMVFLNDQCKTLTGNDSIDLSVGEVCSIDPMIVPEDRPQVVTTVQEAVSSLMPFQVEYRIQDKQDQIRYFWEKGQPIPAQNGQPLHIDGVIFDVTEGKLAEVAHQESQQRLNNILESLQDIVWSVKADSFELLYLSPAAEEIYGRPISAFIDNSQLWLQAMHPDDRAKVSGFSERILETGSQEVEYRIVRPDGSIRWLLDRGRVIKDAEERVLRLDGVATDITERKQSQEQISELAALLNVATDAILVQGPDGRIQYWSKGASALYGWTQEEALSQEVGQLLEVTDEKAAEIEQYVRQHGKWQGEQQQVTKSGDAITVMSRWTLVKDSLGNPKAILIVNTDVTQAKKLEKQFLRAQRLESIGALASGIAHDLNNILTPIYGVAQLLPLQLPNASEQIQHQFEILQTCAQRGSKLITQVLSFSRGADGERAILYIKPLLSELRDFTLKTFPKSIEVSTHIPDDLWSIHADATQVHQVFMNLLVNARDAMPEGGSLSIHAMNFPLDEALAADFLNAQAGPYILITVTDTGIGIPPELQEQIFEPFFTTKEPAGGTGLGLSTVNKIIQSHYGYITVYSEVGQGTQFKVYLPAIESVSSVEEEQLECPNGQGEVVLVVDDEAPIREVAQSMLVKHNYQVMVADDGIDAIAQYAQHHTEIDVVLMDMQMPTLSGETTIQTLRKINPQLKVIVTSGLLVDETFALSLGQCVKAFLQKPFSSDALLRMLQNILQEKSQDTETEASANKSD
ncbi:PAS domain-containing protein (plasmid) [Acaryochloris sp. CCMEE 5410]|nr:PAS domain-containing protein [Acaryochloris sp. CCMEE 5410]